MTTTTKDRLEEWRMFIRQQRAKGGGSHAFDELARACNEIERLRRENARLKEQAETPLFLPARPERHWDL